MKFPKVEKNFPGSKYCKSFEGNRLEIHRITSRNIYIYIYREREREEERGWLTVVEGDPKVPFWISSTPRCWRRSPLPSLDNSTSPWSVSYDAEFKQGGIKYDFLRLGMARPRIEPQSPGSLMNSQTIVHIDIYFQLEKNIYFEINKSANEFQYGIEGFYFYYYLDTRFGGRAPFQEVNKVFIYLLNI